MGKCLFVVDVQRGFVNPDTQEVVERIQTLLDRDLFDHVVCTRFQNSELSPWYQVLKWDGLMTAEEQEIAVRIPAHARIIDKTTYAIPSVGLKYILDVIKGNDIYITGLETDVCVTIIAAQLFDADLAPLILRECVGTKRPNRMQERSLESLGRIVGRSRIVSVSDVT